MRIRIISFFMLILLLLSCLTGCVGEDESESSELSDTVSEIENTNYISKTVTFTEPGSNLSLVGDMDITVDGNAEYAFYREMPFSEREACVSATKKILNFLNVYTDLEIYIYKKSEHYFRYAENGKMYTFEQDYESVDYIADVLFSIFGEYCNYGLVYGYASYLCEELFGVENEYDTPVFADDWQYYDINLLCFDTKFVSAEDKENAQNISKDFVEKYIGENGVKALNRLISASGKTEDAGLFLRSLSDYYAENGITPVLSEILYGYGGISFHYYAVCDYAVFCVTPDWQDRLYGRAPSVTHGFLNSDYPKTREYFEITASEFGNYRTLLGLESYKDGLYIVFNDKNSNYYKDTHCIYMSSHANLMYTYILSLVSETGMEFWKSRGLASYISLKEDVYGIPVINEYYKNRGNGSSWEFANAFVKYTGRDIDVVTDMDDLTHLIMRYFDDYYTETGDSAASFTYYLISLFGEEKVTDYLLGRTELSSLTEKTMDELKADWQIFVDTEYSEYFEE